MSCSRSHTFGTILIVMALVLTFWYRLHHQPNKQTKMKHTPYEFLDP